MTLTVTWAPQLDIVMIETLPKSVDMESLTLMLESKKCGQVTIKTIMADEESKKTYATLSSVAGTICIDYYVGHLNISILTSGMER